jgi:ketosteroid isomerase-like protein
MQPRTHLLCTAVLSAAMCFGTVAIAADTPPAGIASSAEKQEFDKSMQDLDVKYIEAFNRKDAATIASMFSSDAVSVGLSPQMSPSVTGREAIQKGLEDFLKSAANYTDKITGSGRINDDMAWMGGPMSLTIGGKPAQGSWLWVLVRENGDWKTKLETYAFTPPPQ